MILVKTEVAFLKRQRLNDFLRFNVVLVLATVLVGCWGSSSGIRKIKRSSLEGRVESSEGRPLDGITVKLVYSDEGNEVIWNHMQTDRDGRFMFVNVPQGSFKLLASGEIDEWEEATIPVEHDFESIRNYVMPNVIEMKMRRTKFNGRVVYKNREGIETPVVGAVVALIGTDDDTRTDKLGAFMVISGQVYEDIPYMLKVFAGSDFKPEIVSLPYIRLRSDNEIETVFLTPVKGIVDPSTRIPPGYHPTDVDPGVIQLGR